jgi:hypothetical protein
MVTSDNRPGGQSILNRLPLFRYLGDKARHGEAHSAPTGTPNERIGTLAIPENRRQNCLLADEA